MPTAGSTAATPARVTGLSLMSMPATRNAAYTSEGMATLARLTTTIAPGRRPLSASRHAARRLVSYAERGVARERRTESLAARGPSSDSPISTSSSSRKASMVASSRVALVCIAFRTHTVVGRARCSANIASRNLRPRSSGSPPCHTNKTLRSRGALRKDRTTRRPVSTDMLLCDIVGSMKQYPQRKSQALVTLTMTVRSCASID